MISISILLIASIVFSYVLYISYKFIFDPIPVKVSLVLDPDSSIGYLLTDQDKNEKQKPIIYNVDGTSKIFWNNLNKNETNFLWTTPKNTENFDIKIGLYEGCINDINELNEIEYSNFYFENINDFSVKLNEGQNLLILNNENDSGVLDITGFGSQITYSTDTDDKFKLSQFFIENTYFTYTPQYNKFTTDIHILLFDPDQYEPFSKRSALIKANDELLNIEFRPVLPSPNNTNDIGECNQFPRKFLNTFESEKISILMKIEAIGKNHSFSFINNDEMYFKGSNIDGWLSLENISGTELSSLKLSKMHIISIARSQGIITIDGVESQLKFTDQIYLHSKGFNASFSNNKIYIDGISYYALKNKIRINKTKWEHLQIELKLSILSFLIFSIGFFARRIYIQISNFDRINWL